MTTRIDPGEQPPRPDEPRRLTFEDIVLGWPPSLAKYVVPIEQARAGDRQVAVLAIRGSRDPRPLDALAELADVDSIYAPAGVTVRRPLPHVRELFAAEADEQTLANLPGLRSLSIGSRRPLDPASIPAGVVDLAVQIRTVGSVEAVVGFEALERLCLDGAYNTSLAPLVRLERLRWLIVDAGKDLRALGALKRLELVKLSLETALLSNLKAFSSWRALRRLHVDGRRLKGLDGIHALESLQSLKLARPGVRSLAPLAGHPTLELLDLEYPDLVTDWDALALPALRRLRIELSETSRLPTLRFLRALPRLEELELVGEAVADRDISPLAELPRLRQAGFYGDYPESAIEAVRAAQASAKIEWSRPWTTGAAATPAIFEDATARLGVDTNHEAEDLIRATLQRDEPALAARLEFDSEAGALAVHGAPADLARVHELIDTLANTTRKHEH